MHTALKTSLVVLSLVISLGIASAAETLPDAIAAPGLTPVLTAHAVGQQVYECKAGADGKLVWTFREPQASLMVDDKLIGKHYAGPTWELEGGSAVVGKAVGNAPGKTANDIAWLKLEATSHKGSGTLAEVTTVQRINTVRGMPYAADYIFLRK